MTPERRAELERRWVKLQNAKRDGIELRCHGPLGIEINGHQKAETLTPEQREDWRRLGWLGWQPLYNDAEDRDWNARELDRMEKRGELPE